MVAALLSPGLPRRLLPFAVFLTAFSIVMMILFMSMDIKALKHREQFNFSQDLDFHTVAQDNPQFIAYIRAIHLQLPPIFRNTADNTSHVMNALPQNKLVAKLLGYKKGGVFVEAGAYQHGRPSDTEWLELALGWHGLLVQPDPRDFLVLQRQRRHKALSVHACLSPTPYPKEVCELLAHIGPVPFLSYTSHIKTEICQDGLPLGVEARPPDEAGKQKRARRGQRDICRRTGIDEARANLSFDGNVTFRQAPNVDDVTISAQATFTRVKCFPLFSLLLAANMTTADFLSLHVEGAEMQVLKTLPFDQVRIGIISIDRHRLIEETALVTFMAARSYKLVELMNTCYVFKKENMNVLL